MKTFQQYLNEIAFIRPRTPKKVNVGDHVLILDPDNQDSSETGVVTGIDDDRAFVRLDSHHMQPEIMGSLSDYEQEEYKRGIPFPISTVKKIA